VKRLTRALAFGVALLVSATARAEPAAPPAARAAPHAAPRVDIRVLGDERALAQVRVAAAELFSRLDVRLRVFGDGEAAPSESADVPLVLAYIDLRVPTSPLVDVDDGRTRQELMRRSLSDVSSLETGVEATLHVVLASVESLLQLAEGERTQPPAPRPAPVAHASPEHGTGLDVGALLRLVSLGGSRLTPGVGGALELRSDVGAAQLELGLWGALHTTTDLDFDAGHASLRAYALRLMPGIGARLSRRSVVSVAFGAGIDHFVLDSVAAPVGGQGRDHLINDPLLSAQVGLRFPLGGAWFVSTLGTLDLDLVPTRFVIERELRREVLFELPRFRGGLMLVASLSPTAVPRFTTRGAEP
jgi:hypothetical protein